MQQKIHVTFFLTFVTLMAIETFTPNTADAGVTDGLVSAWFFDDGTPRDNIGANHGTIRGGVTPTDGKFGRAMDFNGVDGYIEVPSSASLEQEEAFTVAAWIYVRQGRDYSAIAWKGKNIGWGPNYLFRICTTSNTNMVWGVCSEGIEGCFATDSVINPNEWCFVALTVDGNHATAYVDGIIPLSGQENPNPVPAPYLTFPDNPLEMGRGVGINSDQNNIQYFDGVIDDVAFWNRALSEVEIQDLLMEIVAVEPAGKLTTTWGKMKRR